MEAGTHPGANQLYARALWISRPWRAGSDDPMITEIKTAYGFTSRLALLPQLSIDEKGVSQASLRLKQRVFQYDSGPIDTWRASLQVGGEWFDGRQAGARLGLVSTTIRGRHGINAQVDWHDAEQRDRRFQLNASHLYRIAPAQYAPTTTAAWYTMVESLNYLDPDGNNQSDIALGLLYEAQRWAAEISVRLIDPEEGIDRRSTRTGIGVRALL